MRDRKVVERELNRAREERDMFEGLVRVLTRELNEHKEAEYPIKVGMRVLEEQRRYSYKEHREITSSVEYEVTALRWGFGDTPKIEGRKVLLKTGALGKNTRTLYGTLVVLS